jgi:predicted ATPase/DNA-binding SARP family transcriptional activator
MAPVAPEGVPDAALCPRLRVRTLGGFAAWVGEREVPPDRWSRPTVAALFKVLLSAHGHRLGRDQAIDLLWPETGPEQGAARLRATMHRLRRALGDEDGARLLTYRDEVLALDAGGAPDWLDADAFETAARNALAAEDAAACRAALALYAGDFLPEDRYADWAVGRREELRGLHIAVLQHLAALALRAGLVEEAEGCLRAVLAADRDHEEAALALMRLYTAAGRPMQACRVYERLAAALRDDLDLAPELETQRLYRTLLARRQATPRAQAPRERPLPTNISESLTSFIGRRRELAAIQELLWPAGPLPHITGAGDRPVGCRLLTLTGPGGCGKTRLALQMASDAVDLYTDGVWLAELAALPDSADPQASQVARAVAGVLGVRDDAQRSLPEGIVEALRPGRVLLVLDNCEHVLEACAALAALLARECPGVQILATSREALGVAGEQVWPVPPLALPEGGGVPEPERLLDYESVRLFLDRARAHQPALALTATNAPAVVEICRRLEGLPLALELAAARVSTLGLAGVAARLGESVRLLAGGPRTAPVRQRTLRATLNWSYGLLSRPEQTLLRELAAFRGGCTLEAAEVVCRDPGGGADAPGDEAGTARDDRPRGAMAGWETAAPATEDVLDALGGLVRKSLVLLQERDGVARYRFLEPIRQYGLDLQAEHGERESLQRRHAAYFLELAERGDREWQGPGQRTWLAVLDRERDNLRAALEWARTVGECEAELRLAGALWRFWRARGSLAEGRGWLEEALAGAGTAPSSARARALLGAGALARDQGDLACARTRLEEGLAVARSLGDHKTTGAALSGLGTVLKLQGDQPRARALTEEALRLSRAVGDAYGVAVALDSLGTIVAREGEYAQANRCYQECLALRRDLGDLHGLGVTLNNLAIVAYQQGDYARSAAWLEETIALDRTAGDMEGLATSLGNLASLLLEQDAVERALPLLAEGLILKRDVGDTVGIAYYLFHLAKVAGLGGDAARAGRLIGAAAALWAATGIAHAAAHEAEVARATEALRQDLGEVAFAAAWAAGQAMTLEEAIGLALAASAAL